VRAGICGRDAIVAGLVITRIIIGLTAKSVRPRKMRPNAREERFATQNQCDGATVPPLERMYLVKMGSFDLNPEKSIYRAGGPLISTE
jgi:hypothetical protein